MDPVLRTLVVSRAVGRCEYCRMRQQFDELAFQIDHIIAKKHHGTETDDNLALACFACNNHKGTNISGIDRQSGEIVRLFNPRNDSWDKHFLWNGAILMGRTNIGRTTVDVLAINSRHRIALRQVLIQERVFP